MTETNLFVTNFVNVALGVVLPGARPIRASLWSDHAAPDFRTIRPQ
jgi:hypothetical protein